MQTFKLGDKVSVLHETLRGTVINIDSHNVKIEDNDGFVWEYPVNQLALQTSSSKYAIEDDTRPKDFFTQRNQKKKSIPHQQTLLQTHEIDLHIEELRDEYAYLSNFEIVQAQMTACRAFIQEAMAQHLKKVILIHGKGEGVLKSEIRIYLDRLSNYGARQIEYHDASYQEYGVGGATEVIFYG